MALTRSLSFQVCFPCDRDVSQALLSSESVFVTAGVGTRNYYRKIGYELDGPYMSKIFP